MERETRTFRINKGVNRPLSFKGLQAQYIAYLAVGLVVLLLLFALLYLLGTPFLANGIVTAFSGYLLFTQVAALNKKYGEHGLMKKRAYRKIPHTLKVRDRGFVARIKTKGEHGN